MNEGTRDTIKGILSQNDVAFVIGNGINQRFFNDVKSWIELLKSLWIKFNQNDPNGKLLDNFIDGNTNTLNGLSNTELFDLIELNLYSRTVDKNCYFRDSVNFFQGQQEKFPSIDCKMIDAIAMTGSKNTPLNNLSNENTDLIQNLRQKMDETKVICRDWCQNSIEDADDLSDIDCVNKTIEFFSDPTKVRLYKNQLKKEIAKEYEDEKTSSDFSSFIKVMEGRKSPILTTNFDTYMSSALGLKLNRMGNGFTDYYPWNVYWGRDEKIESPISGFGIWHINGLKNYHRSIQLGLSDYMGSVARARNMIHYKNMNDFFDGKNVDNWAGCNTWLHIVFNKPLFIFGLSLDENEVFFRWLLIQRAKYSKMYDRGLNGWYVDENISTGKQAFLESLGFEVIRADYDDLYNAFC